MLDLSRSVGVPSKVDGLCLDTFIVCYLKLFGFLRLKFFTFAKVYGKTTINLKKYWS